jgi:hypothetical protein
MAKKVKEKVRVQVEITWGREWNGSYLALTPGKGCYVTVMEKGCPRRNDEEPGFRGCPLGTGTTVSGAIADFVTRARHEWQGKTPLTEKMIEVVETRDYREPLKDSMHPEGF